MSFLYVNEQGAVIGLEGGYYVVKERNGVERKIPKETLESITIFGNAHMTEACTKSCLQQGIPVNYYSTGGIYFGKLSSTRHSKPQRIRQQIHLSEDTDFCLAFAKKIISAKIHNQMVVCRRYRKNLNLQSELRNMYLAEQKVTQSTSIPEVMGYEGVVAKIYFSALSQIVEPAFRFQGRTRQPPKDAFNSMLSLGYTMLLYEIYGELEHRGLSPYIGLMHADKEGHPSLASDLMEEWRSFVVDSVVLSLVQGKEIQIAQFETDEETSGVYLKKDAMKIFIQKIEMKFRSINQYLALYPERNSIRRGLYLQSISFLQMLQTKDLQLYEPLRIR